MNAVRIIYQVLQVEKKSHYNNKCHKGTQGLKQSQINGSMSAGGLWVLHDFSH